MKKEVKKNNIIILFLLVMILGILFAGLIYINNCRAEKIDISGKVKNDGAVLFHLDNVDNAQAILLFEGQYADSKVKFQDILNKDSLDELDVLTISEKISTTKKAKSENGKYRSYNKSTILKILDYQKTNQLNNSQLAKHFNLSRNTVAKWKKMFLI